MKILIYDVELANQIITDEPDDPPPGIYARSFTDYENMLIACVCAPTLEACLEAQDGAGMLSTNKPYFLSDSLPRLQRWFDEADLLVSFNGLGFDNPLLKSKGITIAPSACYDIAAEWKTATGRRVSLAALAEANLGIAKSGNGADAPIQWMRGLRDQVISYCFQDCILTARLFEKIQKGQPLKHPQTGGSVLLPKPTTQAASGRLFA